MGTERRGGDKAADGADQALETGQHTDSSQGGREIIPQSDDEPDDEEDGQ